MPALKVMHAKQQSAATWMLEPCHARSLTIGPGARWLQVCEGSIWLTLPGSGDTPSQDVFMAAGESILLPSGSRILIEGWPKARFQLLVPPQACRPWMHRFSAWLAAWLRKSLPSWRPNAA